MRSYKSLLNVYYNIVEVSDYTITLSTYACNSLHGYGYLPCSFPIVTCYLAVSLRGVRRSAIESGARRVRRLGTGYELHATGIGFHVKKTAK